MKQLLSFCAILLLHLSLQAQTVKYTTAHDDWNPDSLGNQRIIINVPQAGKTVKVDIPWRRRDDSVASKQIIIVNAKQDKIVQKVWTGHLDREKGTIYFDPEYGTGNYYIYYMPYRQSGSPYYPKVSYLKNHYPAADEVALKRKGIVNASVQSIQAVNAFSSLYPMEVIATQKETAAIIKANAGKAYIVFPEDRLHAVRMTKDLPQHWAGRKNLSTFTDTAKRGENFAYQLSVYPVLHDLKNITVSFTDLKSATGAVISKNSMQCINTDGVNWIGEAEKFTVHAAKNILQTVWCTVNIPGDAAPGLYKGTVTVQPEGEQPTTIAIHLFVSRQTAINHGVDEPWKQTRLQWLNSTLAGSNTVIKPYQSLQQTGNTISLLGRKVSIAKTGFPEQIQSFFTQEMTGIGDSAKNLFVEPVHFHVKDEQGKDIAFTPSAISYTEKSEGTVAWAVNNSAPALDMQVNGSLEFDGFMSYVVKVIAKEDISLKDIVLHLPFQPNLPKYIMGLGNKGQLRTDSIGWKWDVAHKNQDGAWLGDVNAGLQFSLRDEHYTRPLNTNFYLQKPLLLPASWGNGDKGGISIYRKGSSLLTECFSGSRTMHKGDTLYYNFKLLITPFHAINTDFQWENRFIHKYMNVDTVKAAGATVINIHQGTAINPYINYPFVRTQEMKAYIDSAHRLGLKVKIYNTVRELSNRAYELPALFTLNHEIFTNGKGGGYSWLQEHLDPNYIAAWFTPEAKDAAIINSGLTRWHNYYVEGMNWLTQNIGIDGIYLDDVAFDRDIMKRVKRVLTQGDHPGIIDLHSANQYNKSDGFINSAMLYMELFPYLNRLWFGEYFDYENNSKDFYLTEVSGIPFGLMGEMLQNDGNPWRGMLYGMTSRLLWSNKADPRPLWKAWDQFGIHGSKMIGYWVDNNPLKTGNDNVPATIYKKEKSVMISLASWAPQTTTVQLQINWAALGIDPQHAVIQAPAIDNFQPAKTFGINESIPVEPGKGWVIIINENK